MNWRASVLFDGTAAGTALRLDEPISFWGGVCPATAKIIQPEHPQYNERINNRILVIPEVIGSSSSSAVMLELLYNDIAPAGVIIGLRDAILPIGVMASEQMGWPTIPVFLIRPLPFLSDDLLQLEHGGVISKQGVTNHRL